MDGLLHRHPRDYVRYGAKSYKHLRASRNIWETNLDLAGSLNIWYMGALIPNSPNSGSNSIARVTKGLSDPFNPDDRKVCYISGIRISTDRIRRKSQCWMPPRYEREWSAQKECTLTKRRLRKRGISGNAALNPFGYGPATSPLLASPIEPLGHATFGRKPAAAFYTFLHTL